MILLTLLAIRIFIGFCIGCWIVIIFFAFTGVIIKSKSSILLAIFAPFLMLTKKGRTKLNKLWR